MPHAGVHQCVLVSVESDDVMMPYKVFARISEACKYQQLRCYATGEKLHLLEIPKNCPLVLVKVGSRKIKRRER
jgi:pyrroloquinoline quinone (PQQ) biosynthesis protein C